jgi:arylsulfatase A-like enzyme
MRRRGAPRRLAPWLGAALAVAGCTRAPAPGEPAVAVVRWQDLIVDPREHMAAFDRTTMPHDCADETAFGIELAGGEQRLYRFRLAEPSELVVAACRPPEPAGAPAGLRLKVEREDRNGEEFSLPLPGGWSEKRFALAPDPSGQVRMTLTAAAPAGVKLVVRDLAVRTVERRLPPRPARRAILISLDAFREDAVGAIGHQTQTPVLDRLLAESERFFPCWSEEISTKPSHASILTGLPAAVHGCDRGDVPLAPEFSTVAERLSGAGVATAGFAGTAPFFHDRYGLRQGFETWRLEMWTSAQELRQAEEWVAKHRDDSFFLFVHLYGAHADEGAVPYESPGMTRKGVAARFGLPDFGCRNGECGAGLLLALNAGRAPRRERQGEILRFLYDRGVEALDHDLGTFFAELEGAGLWRDTLVVLTADHGEQFGEHGYFLHTTPHEETLRVPLLVKWPRGRAAGVATEEPTTALDIAPTVLAHFGQGAADLTGRNLAVRAPANGPPVMVSKDAVRLGDLKLIFATPEFPEALYDLATDPGERTNLLPARRADAELLRAVWRRAMERARRLAGVAPAAAAVPFSAAEIERLRSLGYLK